MSESKVACESFPRTSSNSSISNANGNNNNNNNNTIDNGDGINGEGSPGPAGDLLDHPKSRSFLDSLERDRRSPRDMHEIRRNSSHGLDLSKSSPTNPSDETNGLDLTKPEMISASKYPRSSDPTPYTNGIPTDAQPTPAPVSYGPGRSHSAGESISPFRADSVPNGYSPDNISNGNGYKNKFPDAYAKSADPDRYGSKPFESMPSSAAMSSSSSSTASSPTYPSKIPDPYKITENSFPKPQDAYNKILEDYGHNARNNNNNKLSDDYPGKIPPESQFVKMAESYAKQIESLTNGYKSDPSFKKEKSLSPGGYKNDPSPLLGFPKAEPGMTNGSLYGSKTEAVSSSSSQPPNQSLPSILNFSTNHLRGMAAAESGLASYLNSYGVGGPGSGPGGDRGDRGSGNGNGNGSGDTSMSRSSPNNKLACRFCGKTFSQAGYIKAHERLHTGEKPFACSVCGKRFSDPSNWKKHERVHANNKKQSHLMESPDSKVGLFMASISSILSIFVCPLHWSVEQSHLMESPDSKVGLFMASISSILSIFVCPLHWSVEQSHLMESPDSKVGLFMASISSILSIFVCPLHWSVEQSHLMESPDSK
ncbi:uncharacterized protein LOC131944710, partial [Physella acuta]|uniref:uncharacterized protein LOC131944710 n=1 Tax=Physella acuta TaxID=109671 RepID=UPI0027DBFCDE